MKLHEKADSKFTKLMGEETNKKNPQEKPRGVILKEAREEKRLSLTTVHEATKIPLDVLRAIEEGYSVRTLSPFYLKGFFKIYAAYLGVDVTAVVDEPAVGKKPKSKYNTVPKKVPTFDVMDEISKFMTKERKKQLGYIILGLFALFLLSKCVHYMKSRPKSVPKKVVTQSQQPAAENNVVSFAVVEESKVAIPATAPVQEPLKPAMASSPVSHKITLTAKAKDKCWLRVVADGAVVFQGTLSLNAVETWKANDKIVISGRNINQLEFELNGKMIGTLGRRDRQAREVVITKDGLTVTK